MGLLLTGYCKQRFISKWGPHISVISLVSKTAVLQEVDSLGLPVCAVALPLSVQAVAITNSSWQRQHVLDFILNMWQNCYCRDCPMSSSVSSMMSRTSERMSNKKRIVEGCSTAALPEMVASDESDEGYRCVGDSSPRPSAFV